MMKNIKLIQSVLSIIAVASLIAGLVINSGVAGLSQGLNPDSSLQELAMNDMTALNDQTLDSLRGGFSAGNNIEISFGFESIVKVDGILQTRMALNVPKISINTATRSVTYSSVDADTYTSSSLADGLSVSTPDAEGMDILTLAKLLQSKPTIIQNSANNRTIQSLQNVNLKVKGLEFRYNSGISRNLTSSLIDSL